MRERSVLDMDTEYNIGEMDHVLKAIGPMEKLMEKGLLLMPTETSITVISKMM